MKRNFEVYSLDSLPTVQAANIDQYWDVIRTLDPELYLIKIALTETNINPNIVPRVIRSLANLLYTGGWGKIQVFMQKGIITEIKGEDNDKINQPALVE